MCAFDEASFENDLAEIAIEMELYSESSGNDSGEIGTAGNSCLGPGAVHAPGEDMGGCSVVNDGQHLLAKESSAICGEKERFAMTHAIEEGMVNQRVGDALERQMEKDSTIWEAEADKDNAVGMHDINEAVQSYSGVHLTECEIEQSIAKYAEEDHTANYFSMSEFETDEEDFATTDSAESGTKNGEISNVSGDDRYNDNTLMHASSKGHTPSHCTMWAVETNMKHRDAIDAGRTEMQSREAAHAIKTELTNISDQRAEQKIPAQPLSPRKRQLEAASSPVYKRGRGTGCLCNVNNADTHPKFAAMPILQNIKPSLVSLRQNGVQSAQGPWSPLSAPSDGPRSCPICSAQLRVRNVPVRHKGKSTVPAFFCSEGHVFMRCFNNKHHTDLCECKRNRQGKLVHRCELCPKNKQKSVLCDHCLARFGTYTGASSFHPKENCPYYLREHPHLIKHSCLRTLRSLMAAGTMRKLRHPMYATVRMGILLELGDPRRV